MDQPPPRDIRPPVNLRIKFRSESLEQFIERYAVDVSRGGIFIRTREPLAVGTQLKLDFQYQNGGPLMAGDGTVVWIRDPDPSRPNIPPGMGVRFDRLSPESQAVLELLLADKANREKTGLNPVAVTSGNAGMAVRRPSSMFAALEPQGPSSGGLRAVPFTSQLPVTGAPLPATPPPPRGGPVTSILIVPPEAKALGSVSAPAAPPAVAVPSAPAASAEPAASSPNIHAAETPATGIAALNPAAGSAGYRPLGTTKNPFSGLQKLASAPPAARLTSTISTTGRSLGGQSLPPASGADATRNESAPYDDLNEEPTQIAGRVPSFLMSDEDPTSVGGRPLPSEGTNQAALLAEVNRITARAAAQRSAAEPPPPAQAVTSEVPAPPNPGYTPPRSTAGPGKFTGPLQALASDLSGRQEKQSLDLAPPVGEQEPQPARAPERTTDQLLDPDVAPLAPSTKATVSRPNRNLDALALAAAATDVRAQAPRKRSAALVAIIVIVLGGSGVFAFKYFGAHGTTTAPAPAPEVAAAIAPAAPAAAPAVPAAPTAAPAPPAAAPAPSAGEAPAAAPAPSGEAKPEPEAPAAAAPVAPAPSEARAAKEPEPAPAHEPSKVVVTAEPSASHRGGKKKGSHAGRDEGAAASSKAVAAGVPDTLPPAEAPAAAKTAPAAADGSGHQLRVTSKPAGADVSIDGQVIGQTPLGTSIADVSAPHFVSVRKDGYEPFEQMISASSAWTKGKPAKGQPAVPTLKLNAKLKATATAGEGKPAAAEPAAVKEPGKETAPPPPAATAPKAQETKQETKSETKQETKPEKIDTKLDTKVDRPLPPSDDRLPPSTP